MYNGWDEEAGGEIGKRENERLGDDVNDLAS